MSLLPSTTRGRSVSGGAYDTCPEKLAEGLECQFTHRRRLAQIQ